MPNLAEKRRRIQPNKKRSASRTIVVAVVLLLIAGGGIVWASRANTLRQAALGALPGSSQQGSPTATASTLEMTDIDAKVEGGKISVPLDVVKEEGLVSFTYKTVKGETPLLAYVTPSGKVLTAVSMCEPCSSTRFFIYGKRIVCTACYTQWDIETLKGITGGCTRYPPDRLDNVVKDGNILVDEGLVARWKPRV